MNLATTLLFYVLVGAAVAGAILLRHDRLSRGDRLFRAITAVLFWPLYLPLFLQHSAPGLTGPGLANLPSPANVAPASAATGELGVAITQVEAELDLALGSLDGWSGGVLAREQDRFAELRSAWRQQAARIAELDRLLALPAFSSGDMPVAGERVQASETARRENIQRLQAIRQRLHDDLLGTLAKVRELATMIHLARYTGAPAARAEELVEEIAAAVAGLSEVAGWREAAGARTHE
ncbi:MAG: hypothetical protein L0Y71_07935 [Gemmataceae bacterium]|nr:hypothetical protein [Gemmataceae bacterium]